MLSLFWLTFCPIFYFRVFLPCWDCLPLRGSTPGRAGSRATCAPHAFGPHYVGTGFDFEATMAHEIGHVLGFNHPDTFKDANLAATAPMGPATCLEPLNHVELASYPEGYDSIMFSMSKHRDRTCLTADDVQGLHFLYPMCDGVAPEPSCIKERRTSGWLRLLITVALPYFLMSIFLVILITTVRCHQRRQLKELEERVEKVRERGRVLTDFLYSMGTAAANTPANMRRQSSGGLDGAGGSGVGTPRRGMLGRIGSAPGPVPP